MQPGRQSIAAAASLVAAVYAASALFSGVHSAAVQHYYCERHQALEHAHCTEAADESERPD